MRFEEDTDYLELLSFLSTNSGMILPMFIYEREDHKSYYSVKRILCA